MSKTKRTKWWIWIVITAIIVIIVVIFLFYVYRNTSFLKINISEEEVENNNQSTPTSEQTDYTELKSQKLIVPEKYREGVLVDDRYLNLPEDFEISVFAAGLEAPRFFDFYSDNNALIVADKAAGEIVMLSDTNSDGVADERIIVDSDLSHVNSGLFYEGDLYAVEEPRVVVYRDLQADGSYSSRGAVD